MTNPAETPAYSAAGLRFLVDEQGSHGAKWASDEIARLTRERDELKAALEPFVELAEVYKSSSDDPRLRVGVPLSLIRRAAATLQSLKQGEG